VVRRRKADATPWAWIAAGAAALALFTAFCNWVVPLNPHCRSNDCVAMFEREIQPPRSIDERPQPGDTDWSPENIRHIGDDIPSALDPDQQGRGKQNPTDTP